MSESLDRMIAKLTQDIVELQAQLSEYLTLKATALPPLPAGFRVVYVHESSDVEFVNEDFYVVVPKLMGWEVWLERIGKDNKVVSPSDDRLWDAPISDTKEGAIRDFLNYPYRQENPQWFKEEGS